MEETETSFVPTESEILSQDVLDEVLEASARPAYEGGLALTIAMCTGNTECPF